MQNINLERTRSPRRRTPGWLYLGAILIAGLIVWAVVKVLPTENGETGETVIADVMVPDIVPQEAAAAKPGQSSPPAPEPVSDTSRTVTMASATPLLLDAATAKDGGDLLKARVIATEIWNTAANESIRNQAEAILNDVNIELVLTPRDMPEKVEYIVASGDSLDKIRKKFDTTIELVRKSNDIKGSIIRIGDRLRVLQGTFSVQISKSDNDLLLLLNDQFFKRYRVGTGEYNKTPIGDFIINDRIAQPTWWRPDGKSIPFGDPENLLGTHWLSINAKGYGIHGTWEPETIGHQASAGCVRLLNKDIEELYTLLPVGTPVSIRD